MENEVKSANTPVTIPNNMEEVFRFCDTARTPTDAIIAVYMTVNYLTKLFEDE